MGARILVLPTCQTACDRLAEEIGSELIACAKGGAAEYSVDGAIDAALAIRQPVVIADTTDNAGGGSPRQHHFIHADRARHQGAAVAPIWDPDGGRNAFDAGRRCAPGRSASAHKTPRPPAAGDAEVEKS